MNVNLFPICYSIPECKIVDDVPEKTKLVSSIYPGKKDTYIYQTEEDYYNQYRESIFGITFRKGGWDCMRHYEILACGSIPYFPDVESCPKNTMFLFPKKLVLECNYLYGKYKNKNKNLSDFSLEERNECINHTKKLLEHTKLYLTTINIGKHIIKTLGEKRNITNISKILFLSCHEWTEYLRCTVLHGLKLLFGSNCHDYPKIKHLYKNEDIDYDTYCYGKGFSHSNLLDQSYYNGDLDSTIIKDIKERKYDIIIWGDCHRNFLKCCPNYELKFYDLASKIYPSENLIFINGWDEQFDIYDYYMKLIEKNHTVFVRECIL
jgi:hypothetical protein